MLVDLQCMGVCRNFFRGENILRGATFEIHSTGTKEGAENKIELLKGSIFQYVFSL